MALHFSAYEKQLQWTLLAKRRQSGSISSDSLQGMGQKHVHGKGAVQQINGSGAYRELSTDLATANDTIIDQLMTHKKRLNLVLGAHVHVHIDGKEAEEAKDAAANSLITQRDASRDEQGEQAEHSKDGASSVCSTEHEDVLGRVQADAIQVQQTCDHAQHELQHPEQYPDRPLPMHSSIFKES